MKYGEYLQNVEADYLLDTWCFLGRMPRELFSFVKTSFTIENPKLRNFDSRILDELVSEIHEVELILHQYRLKFGVHTVELSRKAGFFFNFK